MQRNGGNAAVLLRWDRLPALKKNASTRNLIYPKQSRVTDRLDVISGAHEEHFNVIAGRVAAGFKGVFPVGCQVEDQERPRWSLSLAT